MMNGLGRHQSKEMVVSIQTEIIERTSSETEVWREQKIPLWEWPFLMKMMNYAYLSRETFKRTL